MQVVQLCVGLKQHSTLLSVHSDNQKHTYKNYILTLVQSSSITHRALWYPQLQGVSIRARAKTVQNVRVLVKWRIQITIWGINLWQTIHILVFLQVYILWTLNYEITSFSVLLSTKLLDNSEHDIIITPLLLIVSKLSLTGVLNIFNEFIRFSSPMLAFPYFLSISLLDSYSSSLNLNILTYFIT